MAVIATSVLPALLLIRIAHLLPVWREPKLGAFAVQALALAAVFLLLRVRPGLLSPKELCRSGLEAGSWLVLATLLFSLLVLGTALPPGPEGGNVQALLSNWARDFPVTGMAGRLAFVTVLVPIFEEFLYRGLILGYLLRGVPAWLALGLATVLFAAGHGSWLVSGVLGVALGLLYLRYRNLWLCVLVHAAHNLVSSAAATMLVAELRDAELALPPPGAVLPLQVGGLALVIASLAKFIAATVKPENGRLGLDLRRAAGTADSS